MSIYDFQLTTIRGEVQSMDMYQGKVILIVNTATQCGFTPQLTGLQTLHEQYADRGLVVLGFPCNQFGSQEPGANDEVAQTCQINYGVTFTLTEKVDVNGDDAHPIFKYLKKEQGGFIVDAIKWNFTKFLIDRHGNVVERYGSATKPEDLVKDIEKLL